MQLNAHGRVQPGLAASWQVISDNIWQFKLRSGVLFHNGDAFAAADVVFTLKRVPNVPNDHPPTASTPKRSWLLA